MSFAALGLAALLAVTATAQEQVYDVGSKGVTTTVPTKTVHAQMTPGAMRDKVQGRVGLRAVVLADGRVGDVEVTKALYPDLDEECVRAMKRWEFKPGTREGKPVAVGSLSR